MFCPKHSHELALKRIGRYLMNTASRGMIINPTKELVINAYPDADFVVIQNIISEGDKRCYSEYNI